MAPSRRFANYPGAQEAPKSTLGYEADEDKNPALRGWPLAITAKLVTSSTYIQKLLWYNAKFGNPKTLPALEEELYRFNPAVIPLADGASEPPALDVSTESFSRQPENLPGRFYSAADFHALYRSGDVTPLDVAEALLPLIRRDVPAPSKYANAWIQTDADAVLAAARASTERWAAGAPLGIMDGVPFGVKDDIDVEGFVSSGGIKLDKSHPYFGRPATKTAWPVRKLEEAGGIMMGKMNMHEIGMDTTGCNPATGTPTNWYNKSYYPGGSSSGAGSAVGGGIVPIALGTDSGGSIRIPPCHNGVYGLKVTFSRTCTRNSTMCVVGPASATVDDLAIAYRIMAQPDASDPMQSLLAPSTRPATGAKKYIGIHGEWLKRADARVAETVRKAVDYLVAKHGYEVVEVDLPCLREGQLAHSATCLAEAADEIRTWANDGSGWVGALSYANQVLVSIGAQCPAVDLLKYSQVRQLIMRHLAHLFERYPGLLLVTPTTPLEGSPVHPGDQRFGFSDGNRAVRSMTYCWLANTSGCPAVTCPAGYLDGAEHGDGPLPVGIMATGEWGAEEQLLAFAKETEAYLDDVYPGGRRRPAEWADVVGMAREKRTGERDGGKGDGVAGAGEASDD